MTRLIRIGLFFLICVVGLVPFARAQQFVDPPAAPIPVQILSGKKVFLSNAGNTVTARDAVPVGLPFDELYAAAHAWRRYELVSAPADADLIFEFSYQYLFGDSRWETQLRLAILDAKTLVALWAFTQPVNTLGQMQMSGTISTKQLRLF